MKLQIEWGKPIVLRDASRENMIYKVDAQKIPAAAGIYIFGRRWARGEFEALCVGKAGRLRGRIKNHFNNLRVMQHLRNAKAGKRLLLTGRVITKPHHFYSGALNDAGVPNGKQGIRKLLARKAPLQMVPARGVPLPASGRRAAARSHERATANSRPPPISYLTLALCAFSAAAFIAEGSAKATTASPRAKLSPGSPPKP